MLTKQLARMGVINDRHELPSLFFWVFFFKLLCFSALKNCRQKRSAAVKTDSESQGPTVAGRKMRVIDQRARCRKHQTFKGCWKVQVVVSPPP